MARLLDVMWEDILFPHVLSRLTVEDLFSLRLVSKEMKLLTDAYLTQMRVLSLCFPILRHPPKLFGSCLFQCTQLRVVNFSSCAWLVDSMVIPIFESNVHITHLFLNRCQSLTSVCLQSVMLYCKKLKVLQLAYCSWLSEGCFNALTLHLENLEEIDLTSCVGSFDTRSLDCFFRKFPRLKKVSLAGNDSVTNALLISLASSCKELKHVNLVHCVHITNAGIKHLSKMCTLQTLAMRHCPGITFNVLKYTKHVMTDFPPVHAGSSTAWFYPRRNNFPIQRNNLPPLQNLGPP